MSVFVSTATNRPILRAAHEKPLIAPLSIGAPGGSRHRLM